MIKVGTTGSDVLVSLTQQEFKKLTKQNHDDVSDGTVMDSVWLFDLIKVVKDNEATLKKIKKAAEDLADEIGNIV